MQPATTAAAFSSRAPLLGAAVLSLALASSVLIIPFDDRMPYYAVVAGFVACLLVPIWYTSYRGRFDVFETVNVLGVLYFLFYGMGAVWSVGDPENVAYDIQLVPFLLQAAIYSLLGYMAFLAGYFNPLFSGQRRRRLDLVPKSAWFLMIPAAIGSVGSLARVIVARTTLAENRIAEFASSVAQLAPLFVVAWGALWILVLSGKATQSQRRLLWAMAPLAALISYETYSKATTIVLAAVPIMALWYTRRRLPWKTLTILILVVVFAIFPFWNLFRTMDPYLPQEKRLQLTIQTLSSKSAGQYAEGALTGFEGRMALVNSVAIAIRDVGRWVPFANGSTIFGPTLAFLVPRALWPDKPYFETGRDFGKLFRIVGVQDQLTSIAPTVVGELYWNFNLPGILAGMVLFGALIRMLYRRYGEGMEFDPIRRAAHMAIVVHITHFDGGIAGHSAGLLHILVMFEGVIWLGHRLGQFEIAETQG